MKKLLIILFLLLSVINSFANKVDDIKTDSDVVKFLLPLNKSFTARHAPPLVIPSIATIIKDNLCSPLAKTWGIKNWKKIDFNNDNRTDLLAIVQRYDYECYIAIDNGDNTFKLILIKYGSDDCELINPIRIKKQNFIVFHGYKFLSIYDTTKTPRTDTLIYKFDNFIELNEHPAKYEVDSLILTDGRIEQGGCASCPDFNMAITKDDTLSFNRYVYGGRTVEIRGEYKVIDFSYKTEPISKAKLFTNQRDELFSLVKYINLKKLKERYDGPYTEVKTITLRVKFKDGTSKNITDHGGYGTFGLHALFIKLFAIARANHANTL